VPGATGAATGRAPAKRRPVTRLVAAVPDAVSKYLRDRCPQLAAAVSYHVLFSLVPLFMFSVSIFGIVLSDDDVRADLIDELLRRLPLTEEAGADLEQILSSVPAPASGLGLVALLGLLWSASGMMTSLRVALTAAFSDENDRPYFRSKLVDFLLVLAVAAILFVSFGLSLVAHAVQRWSETLSDALSPIALTGWGVLGNLAAPILAFGAFTALYHFVPPNRPRVRDVWLGALVAAAGFTIVNVGFSYYLATMATWSLLYGSLGSVLAFLFVVYVEAAVVLFGGEFAAAWIRNAEEAENAAPAQPIGRQLLGLVKGLFVRS
jgi:membrane protein